MDNSLSPYTIIGSEVRGEVFLEIYFQSNIQIPSVGFVEFNIVEIKLILLTQSKEPSRIFVCSVILS